MIPGINPRDMQKAMKRLGINQQEIEATEVIIKTRDSELVIHNPQVSKVNMMGQETFQIVGTVEKRQLSSGSGEPEISEEDIATVMDQAGVTEDEARQAIIENNNDLAKAILVLKAK